MPLTEQQINTVRILRKKGYTNEAIAKAIQGSQASTPAKPTTSTPSGVGVVTEVGMASPAGAIAGTVPKPKGVQEWEQMTGKTWAATPEQTAKAANTGIIPAVERFGKGTKEGFMGAVETAGETQEAYRKGDIGKVGLALETLQEGFLAGTSPIQGLWEAAAPTVQAMAETGQKTLEATTGGLQESVKNVVGEENIEAIQQSVDKSLNENVPKIQEWWSNLDEDKKRQLKLTALTFDRILDITGAGLTEKGAVKAVPAVRDFAELAGKKGIDLAESGVKFIGEGSDNLSGMAKNTLNKLKEKVSPDVLVKRNSELRGVVDGNKPLRNYVEKQKGKGFDPIKDVADTDLLNGAVTKEGVIRTKGDGMAVAEYNKFLDPQEKVVSKVLKAEGVMLPITEVEKQLKQSILDSGLQGKSLTKALKDVMAELEGYKLRVEGEDMIPLSLINDAKISKYKGINYLSDNAQVDKTIARGLKEMVENNTKSADIAELNKELARHYANIEFLEKLDGARVKGGRMGKYFAKTVGGVAGSSFGMGGAVVGAEVGGWLQSKMMKNTFSGTAGKALEESKAIRSALDNTQPLNLSKSSETATPKITQPKKYNIDEVSPNIPEKSSFSKGAIPQTKAPLTSKAKKIEPFADEFKGKTEVKEAIKDVSSNTGEKMVETSIDIDKLKATQTTRDVERLSRVRKEIEAGIKYPLVVEFQAPNFYDVWDGNTRLQVYKELGIKDVPIVVNKSGVPKAKGLAKGAKVNGRSMGTEGVLDRKPLTVDEGGMGSATYEKLKKGDLVKYDAGMPSDSYKPKNAKTGEWQKAEDLGMVGREYSPNSSWNAKRPKSDFRKGETLQAKGLAAEAKKYKSADEFVNSQLEKGYRSAHQVDTKTSSPVTKISEDTLTTFTDEFKRQYGYPSLKSKEVNKLKSIISNPEADVTVYRASPKNELNSGDWVTIDKDYANDIRKQNGGKVYTHTVKAEDLFYPKTLKGFKDLPSLNKWGAFQYQSSKVKSQLTDIWNKANKGAIPKAKGLLAEARKYKSADEFVKSIEKPKLPEQGYPRIKDILEVRKERFENMKINGTKHEKEFDLPKFEKEIPIIEKEIIRYETELADYKRKLSMLDDNQIKTKSQLTDIWNKANKRGGTSSSGTQRGVDAVISEIESKGIKIDPKVIKQARKLPDGKVAQSKKELDAIYAKAPKAKKELDNMADDISSKVSGIHVAKAPPKKYESAFRKIIIEYDGESNQIGDVVRNTIVVRSEKDYLKYKKVIDDLGAIKSKITKPETDPLGFSSINSKFRVNGIDGEIQINTPDIIFAKEPAKFAKQLLGDDLYKEMTIKHKGKTSGLGHGFYEAWRVLNPTTAKAKAIAAQSRKYYKLFR